MGKIADVEAIFILTGIVLLASVVSVVIVVPQIFLSDVHYGAYIALIFIGTLYAGYKTLEDKDSTTGDSQS